MSEQIYFRFLELDLTKFVLYEFDCIDSSKPLDLSSSFQFAYNFDEDIVCCTTSIVMARENIQILNAELRSFYKIQSESVAAITDNDCVVLPTGLMTQFASLCYGAMRGVIYAKTMGTPLAKVVLPPNDIQAIFNAPITFERL